MSPLPPKTHCHHSCSFTFLIHFNDSMSSLLIMKRFELHGFGAIQNKDITIIIIVLCARACYCNMTMLLNVGVSHYNYDTLPGFVLGWLGSRNCTNKTIYRIIYRM